MKKTMNLPDDGNKAAMISHLRTAVIVICVLLLVAFCMSGCKTKKAGMTESSDTRDSVIIEYLEKIVKVPVIVEVEVPVEMKEKTTRDSTSHLETSFAVSDAAMVWIDGVPFLRHSIENKPQTIRENDSVPVIEKEKTVWKTRRVSYNKTLILEKQLTTWQYVKITYGGYALVAVSLYLIYRIYRARKKFF